MNWLPVVTLAWLVLILPVPGALAQSYPSRPLEIIVHTGAGGGNDRVARVFVEILQREKLVNQPMTVLNKPGGGGSVAFNYIKAKRGDPHVILSGAGSTLLTASLRPELGVSLDQFTPLALLARDPQAVIVSADSPYRTFKDLVDAGKRESLVGSFASVTGSGRMLLWLIERETGVRFKAVSMKSGAEAIMSVMGGHVHLSTENISEGLAALEGRKVRVLAVSSARRMPAVPDVPTFTELGYSIQFGSLRGFAMSSSVPKEAVEYWEGVLERVYQSAGWKAHAESSYYENVWMRSADYSKHLVERRAVMEEFLRGLGVLAK